MHGKCRDEFRFGNTKNWKAEKDDEVKPQFFFF